MKKRDLLKGIAVTATTCIASAAQSAPALVKSTPQRTWRMTTSWPKNLQGPGISAQNIASQITALSENELNITVFAADVLAPALGVLDAVANSGIEMGHTASAFDGGKDRLAPLFTGMPGGLTPLEHQGWIETGGGQALWDALYAPFGVKPLMAGNTGPSMGGWFRTPVKSLADLKGIKMRMPGLGADIFSQLGVSCLSLAPGDTFAALQAGTIDGAEFANPGADMALGLHQVAKNYYGPGFHEPNGVGALYINLEAWRALPQRLRDLVTVVAHQEHARAFAETMRANAAALHKMATVHNVIVRQWPQDIQNRLIQLSRDMLQNFGDSQIQSDILRSYRDFQTLVTPWTNMSIQQYLQARQNR